MAWSTFSRPSSISVAHWPTLPAANARSAASKSSSAWREEVADPRRDVAAAVVGAGCPRSPSAGRRRLVAAQHVDDARSRRVADADLVAEGDST